MDTDRGRYLIKEFWASEASALFVDARRSTEELALFQKFYLESEKFPAHVWLASSGSSQTLNLSTKLIGLSKQAILESAESVNDFLEITTQDIWGLCLPEFHIGGLSIWARSSLVGTAVFDYSAEKWNPIQFHQNFEQDSISLLSLVPTQIYDLVSAGLRSPPALRVVIIGGGALDPLLYTRARNLGWPLLPSFGMTEACSQIATAELSSLGDDHFPDLSVLEHFEYKINDKGLLGIKGPSLMTGYWQSENGESHFHRHDPSDYFWTSDFVEEVRVGVLKPLGREADFVKILGEGVHLGQVEQRFQQTLVNGAQLTALVTRPNERTGFDLVLLTDAPELAWVEKAVTEWNKSCIPVERFSEVRRVDKIPRTALGKIQRHLI